jgi:hypothetical protein
MGAPIATSLCIRLQTKAYYRMGPEATERCDFSPEASYWCARRVTALGPDDTPCAPEACQPGRTCFEAESGAAA